MNLIDYTVLEIFPETKRFKYLWLIDAIVEDMGGRKKTTLTFKTEEELDNLKIGSTGLH